jgi:hypothetical protein
MRDERIQHAGPFPRVKGSRIDHPKLLAFIERNYGHDADGAWFFQNGPQRVYLQLEVAPWVWRLGEDGSVYSHTGQPAQVQGSWLDEAGRLFLHADIGFGIVHTLDMETAAQAVESGRWQPQELPFAQMPGRFGYVLNPQPQAGG